MHLVAKVYFILLDSNVWNENEEIKNGSFTNDIEKFHIRNQSMT